MFYWEGHRKHSSVLSTGEQRTTRGLDSLRERHPWRDLVAWPPDESYELAIDGGAIRYRCADCGKSMGGHTSFSDAAVAGGEHHASHLATSSE